MCLVSFRVFGFGWQFFLLGGGVGCLFLFGLLSVFVSRVCAVGCLSYCLVDCIFNLLVGGLFSRLAVYLFCSIGCLMFGWLVICCFLGGDICYV